MKQTDPSIADPISLALPARDLHDLGQHLRGLHAALTDLSNLTDEKLAGMKSADTAALHRCAAREADLLRQVFNDEHNRNAVLARLAQALQCGARTPPRLSEIADRLPEPLASSLRARNAALKVVAGELKRKNGLAAKVARNLQNHIRGVFAEVASASQESLGYGPKGQHETSDSLSWVDAIG